ncbi:stalk domain-containing protein [Paenibacillus tyrfis]|uniref:stalk domain-containing protein n=1 Tax=Paenibacillus tyrfis TaxID=1501230 RepID=UPI00209EAA9A|nr:stalk domain-containing protein [Paenibacillus tyrfis]MCP1308611.1 copper amine oxidase N-terminal domain-containing protein [Paenibacillus tyrfis]
MRKYIIASIVCVFVVITVAAYGASSSLDFLTSEKFVINGVDKRLSVINYNGHVYVPLRSVTEQMAADIDYREDKRTTYIQQQSVKFDERTLAPVPYVAYEKKTDSGIVWMQEIPLLDGNACWTDCFKPYTRPSPASEIIKQAEYPPVAVKPESDIVITYPKGMEPLMLEVTMVSESDAGKKEGKAVPLGGNRLHLPKQPGRYHISIYSTWDQGQTLYIFAIDVK